MLKERQLIEIAAKLAAERGCGPSVVLGIGDDCALLQPDPDKYLAVTTDCLAEGIHFDLAYFSPYELGSKAAAVNLSDIAAMGGVPKWAFVAISTPTDTTPSFMEQLFTGITKTLAREGACLAGGDSVASTGPLTVTVTVMGEVDKKKYLARDRARPGELIFCSGSLGLAAMGLEWLKCFGRKGKSIPRYVFRKILTSHLLPQPRLKLGQALAASGLVRCAIDVSDGPATDIAHICDMSRVKAVIYKNAIPISRASKVVGRILKVNPLLAALQGGEDFELIWTAHPSHQRQIAQIADLVGTTSHVIGKIVKGRGVWLDEGNGIQKEISYKGYEHEL